MATVTVLGTGGSTVTIQMTSAANAAAAQTALWGVSNLAAAPGLAPPNPNPPNPNPPNPHPHGVGVLQQQDFTGSGAVPVPANLLGGVVVQGAGDVGALTAQYVSVVVAATGNSTIVGPSNFRSVLATTDGSNTTYVNLSQQGEVHFGAGDNFLVQDAGATAFFDAGNSVMQTASGSVTDATLADKALLLVQGDGKTQIRVEQDADVVVQVQGSSTVPVRVQGGDYGNNPAAPNAGTIQYLAVGGAAIIEPGNSDVTIFGNVGSGQVSVYGPRGQNPTPIVSYGGRLTVLDGQGYFQAGGRGGSLLFSSTVEGSATLVGFADGDQLFSMGAGQYLVAGWGAETLSGFSLDASVGGSIFQSWIGHTTIFGNSGGGNAFAMGAGLTLVDGRNEAALGGAVGRGNTYYSVAIAGGGGIGVSDFISGLDTFNMTVTTQATGQQLESMTYYEAGAAGSPFQTGSGTRLILNGGTIFDFFGSEVKLSDIV